MPKQTEQFEKSYDLSAFSSEERTDIFARLSILFPNVEVNLADARLAARFLTEDDAQSFSQAAHDQLIRTKYDRDTRMLRQKLYENLLQ